jgi:hypothetical protein
VIAKVFLLILSSFDEIFIRKYISQRVLSASPFGFALLFRRKMRQVNTTSMYST